MADERNNPENPGRTGDQGSQSPGRNPGEDQAVGQRGEQTGQDRENPGQGGRQGGQGQGGQGQGGQGQGGFEKGREGEGSNR